MSDDQIRKLAEDLFSMDLASRRAKFAQLSAEEQDAVVAYLDSHYASYRAWLGGAPPPAG
jgi:hypothetical protein